MRPVVWKYVILIRFPNIDIGLKLFSNLDDVRKRRFNENLSGFRQMHTGPDFQVSKIWNFQVPKLFRFLYSCQNFN